MSIIENKYGKDTPEIHTANWLLQQGEIVCKSVSEFLARIYIKFMEAPYQLLGNFFGIDSGLKADAALNIDQINNILSIIHKTLISMMPSVEN